MSASKRSSVASSSSAGLLWVALAALGIAVLLAAAAYTAYWFLAFETLRSQFQAWVEQQRAEGNRVTYYSEERSGFPFVIRLTLREMLVTTPEGVSWLSTLTGLEARPLIGDSLRLTFGGEQELRLPLRRGTEMLSLSARAEQLSLDLGGAGTADAADLAASNLTLSLKRRAGALLIPALSVTVRSEPALDKSAPPGTAPPGTAPPGPAGASSGGGRRLALAASGIVLPEGIASPLGRTVAEIALAARLAGDLPRGIPLSQAPSAWREAGGHIAIERLALVYGPLSLAGDGMVAIDPEGQPSGALALRIAGLHPTVDALVDRGILSPAVAETVLALAQTLAPAGAGGTVTLPLTLQDQTLSLGGMTVARLPPLPSQPR